MGADAPMPPVLMNAAAPGGAPPRRISDHPYHFGKKFIFFFAPGKTGKRNLIRVRKKCLMGTHCKDFLYGGWTSQRGASTF